MRLNERSLVSEEDLFECDRCHVQGERKVFVLEEKGQDFCLSCWLEKEHNRLTSRPVYAGF